ncbi:DUF3761 domain-containing protein [Streptacidiphilus sp. N1-12]|uniref:DUF3761 domain-containing protein n=2 Tax=Streptacidiphilus alkalitolerans TaxID=3342712 RepID=A0ABV6WK47_9ACTN
MQHRIIAAISAIAATAAVLVLAGCSTETAAATPPSKTSTLPDLIGEGLQSAQDTAQAAGFNSLKSHDALGRHRHQIFDRDWKVCTQTPAPGSQTPDATVDLGAVKTNEQCPGTGSRMSTPSTAATNTPTPSPPPSPTHVAKPKPTHAPTHSSSTNGSNGGSSGGSSGSTSGDGSPGDGATALCNDGTYSHAAHHRGACSSHGGVAVFYN